MPIVEPDVGGLVRTDDEVRHPAQSIEDLAPDSTVP
jgi:hypothetical protein